MQSDKVALIQRLTKAMRWRTKRAWRATIARRSPRDKPQLGALVDLPELTGADAKQLRDGAAILEKMLADPRGLPDGLPNVLVNHAIAVLESGGDAKAAIERVQTLGSTHPTTGEGQVLRFARYLRDSGRYDDALQMMSGLYDKTRLPSHGAALYRLQIRSGDIDLASSTLKRIADAASGEDQSVPLLRVEGLLSQSRYANALEQLESLPLETGLRAARQRLRAYSSLGQYQEILDEVDDFDHLDHLDIRIQRFDALCALGKRDAAHAELAAMANMQVDFEIDDRIVDRVWKVLGPAAAQELLERARAAIGDTNEGSGNLEGVGTALFHMNRPTEAVDVLRRAESLTPSARRVLAQSLYTLRRFDDALDEIDALRGTKAHSAAMKLRARILLELGRSQEALDNRLRFGRPGDGSDEIAYHALLSLGRHGEAFSRQPNVADLRDLRADFGARAEAHPFDHPETRFVVADAGPGDEIQDASLIPSLLHRSEKLVMTCDPRLLSLMQRSFPSVEWLPVARLRNPPHFGSHSPDVPIRSGTALDRLLTAQALERALQCDRVSLARSIKALCGKDSPHHPAPAFLRTDPERFERHQKGRTSTPLVGLVWRSELLTSMRGVHYLDVADLAPLAAIGAQMVCLQHDVTAEERGELHRIFGPRVVFRDDVDLRDDFEETAALVASLDLVIGVGTTATNLSAAVGCPTIMLQPTHFGTWLAIDEAGQHFWYEDCTVVTVDARTDTERLVKRGRDLAISML